MGHVCVHGFVQRERFSHRAVVVFNVRVFLVILSSVLLSVCTFTKRTHCANTPCGSRLTMIHCGLPQGHWGGWVHTVNYTSHPLVWFIALITVGSLKKEKGEEAYKIKKKDWKCHSDRERGRIVCECMRGLLVYSIPSLFTAVNYSGASALSLQ